ncbi:hypothetical protein GW17_00025513 [Ensete ventricosum]|uniref:Uncharacterized protein n=1 Tax=Ensete ventricosum TaxID=4639 RepID=A0A444EKW8_ENSVE|nr:hypothetical protein B296_00008408 [Ensete ventricosum]RWW10914.1 hypothetical protein GW17_00025513 [Ensete ventricosum]
MSLLYYRDFDEGILPRISEVLYEDEMKDFPPAPDVGNFLISEVNFTLGKFPSQLASPEPSFQGSPAREEGEVPESELDPDTRRRLLILQHGQDTREPTPSFPVSPPLHVSIPPVQPQGSWFPLEEEIDPRQQDSEPKEFSREPDPGRYRKRSRHPSFMHGGENTVPSDRVLHEPRRLPIQVTYAFDLVSVRY